MATFVEARQFIINVKQSIKVLSAFFINTLFPPDTLNRTILLTITSYQILISDMKH